MAKPRILQQLDGELSSDIILNADPDQSMEAVTKQYVDTIESNTINYMNNNLLSKNNDSGSNITLTNANITLTADPTTNMQAATKQYVDNSGGIFYATYGTTTYAEIVEAFEKGKGVKALYSNTSSYVFIFDLVTRPTGSNTLCFAANNKDIIGDSDLYGPKYCLYINSNSSWTVSSNRYDYTSNTLRKSAGTTSLSDTTRYYRPILVSTTEPTANDGDVGDIWLVYEE